MGYFEDARAGVRELKPPMGQLMRTLAAPQSSRAPPILFLISPIKAVAAAREEPCTAAAARVCSDCGTSGGGASKQAVPAARTQGRRGRAEQRSRARGVGPSAGFRSSAPLLTPASSGRSALGITGDGAIAAAGGGGRRHAAVSPGAPAGRYSDAPQAPRRRAHLRALLGLCFPKGTRPTVIARVLHQYTGPSISRFASYAADNDDVAEWVIALSRRSVQSITIIKELGKPLTLHSSIFSCDRLVSLSLDSCNIPPVPRSGFAGFPVLQKLYLNSVNFTGKGERGLQAIIQGSPLLCALKLWDVEMGSLVDCVIEAPNLQTSVLLSTYDTGWRFGRLPRLQYANIDVAEYEPGGHRLLEFFTGVSQVHELILYLPGNSCELKIDRISFTFHNLKRLEISNFHYMDMAFILLLFSLLRSSPNLVELKIEIEKSGHILSEECYDAQWTDGMCANLQVVRIESHFGWLPLSFMKLILSKASVLRILSMVVCRSSHKGPPNELLKCRRASAHAQILFKEDLDSDTDGDLYSDTDYRLEELDSDTVGELDE